MKKRIVAIVFSFLLSFLAFLPVSAKVGTDTSAEIVPEERILPRLADEADLLSSEEETALLENLDEISERQQCDVVVVTVNSLEGKTAEAYADDYFDYNGAFTKYAKLCDDFLTQAKKGEPYDNGNLPKGSVSPLWIFADLAIGFILAFLLGSMQKAKLKSVRKQATAKDYTVSGSMVLTEKWDQMVNKTLTTRRIERDTDKGSSTHSSSSGESHGGSGGKF